MAAPHLSRRWRCHTKGPVVHVWPIDDLIAHDTDDDDAGCVCGPRVEPVPCEDGSMSWLLSHNSLDGREKHEVDYES